MKTKKILSAFVVVLFATSVAPAFGEQPHMRAALEHLRAARTELDKAAPDKAGHRQNAIALVDKAIAETVRGQEAARPDQRPAR